MKGIGERWRCSGIINALKESIVQPIKKHSTVLFYYTTPHQPKANDMAPSMAIPRTLRGCILNPADATVLVGAVSAALATGVAEPAGMLPMKTVAEVLSLFRPAFNPACEPELEPEPEPDPEPKVEPVGAAPNDEPSELERPPSELELELEPEPEFEPELDGEEPDAGAAGVKLAVCWRAGSGWVAF